MRSLGEPPSLADPTHADVVQAAASDPPHPAPRPPAGPDPLLARRRRHGRWALALGAACILVLAAATVLGVRLRAAGRGPSLRSVALMPVRNLTGDPKLDAAADQLTEDVIDTLDRNVDLKVAPREAVFDLRGKASSLKAADRKLHVRNLAVASLRKIGGGYQASIQIVDPTTGRTILTQTFDEMGAWSPDLEQRLALSLFETSAQKVVPRWRKAEAAKRADDHDPDNILARIEAISGGGPGGSVTDEPRIARLLRLPALKADERAAAAADSYACYYYQALNETVYAASPVQRLAWANKALTLGAVAAASLPLNAWPHSCRAWVFGQLGEWDLGLAEVRHVFDIQPLTAVGFESRGHIEFDEGDFDAAVKDFRELAAREDGDPLDVGTAELFAGREAEAAGDMRQAEIAARLDPEPPFLLAAALELSGHRDEARSEAQAYLVLKSDDRVWRLLETGRGPAFAAAAAKVREAAGQLGLKAPVAKGA